MTKEELVDRLKVAETVMKTLFEKNKKFEQQKEKEESPDSNAR